MVQGVGKDTFMKIGRHDTAVTHGAFLLMTLRKRRPRSFTGRKLWRYTTRGRVEKLPNLLKLVGYGTGVSLMTGMVWMFLVWGPYLGIFNTEVVDWGQFATLRRLLMF